jgi:hypothetical protein
MDRIALNTSQAEKPIKQTHKQTRSGHLSEMSEPLVRLQWSVLHDLKAQGIESRSLMRRAVHVEERDQRVDRWICSRLEIDRKHPYASDRKVDANGRGCTHPSDGQSTENPRDMI